MRESEFEMRVCEPQRVKHADFKGGTEVRVETKFDRRSRGVLCNDYAYPRAAIEIERRDGRLEACEIRGTGWSPQLQGRRPSVG